MRQAYIRPPPPINVSSFGDLVQHLTSFYKCYKCGELILRLNTVSPEDEIYIQEHLDSHFKPPKPPIEPEVLEEKICLVIKDDCDETCVVCGDLLRINNRMTYDHDLDEWVFLDAVDERGHRVHADCAEYLDFVVC